MNVAIRNFDWASTELGIVEEWPDALKALVALMLGSTQPMFMAWGLDKVWLYNAACIPILGEKHPSALGSRTADVWAEAWDALEPLVENAYRGVPVQMDDFDIKIYRNGSLDTAHFSFSYNPAFDALGSVKGMFGVCTETTAQVKAQRNLARSEGRLQMALSAGNGIGVWNWDVVTDSVTADERFADLYGVDRQQAEQGAPIRQFLANVQTDDLIRLKLEITQALRTGEPFSTEYRLVQPDGSVRWVMAQGQAALNQAGQAVHFSGVTFDNTNRKLAELRQTMLSN